jgi:peptide/nickel transport system substrate-binding protein
MSTTHSRRTVLAAAALALPLALPLTTGCSPGGSAGGGRLRAAFAAGGAQERLDPHVLPLFVDQARAKACFDTLTGWGQDMTAEPRLAESWESDATGTRWNVRLRPATWHDGRPVTARDVLYSFRRIADPATTGLAAALFTGVDFAASRAVSDTELELVLGAPNFVFPLSWGAPGAEIVPQDATDFTAPIGSGPFRFVSFTPGGPAVYAAHDGYWDGRPAVDELEFVPVNEESARLGALLSGQVQYADDLRATSAAQLASDPRATLLTAPAANTQFLALRVDRPPFDDAGLREAVRLGIDREALVRVALLGRGRVGNDLFGQGLQYYDAAVPQVTRDVERAKALVAEAGATGLQVELQTSGVDPNYETAADLIAPQLAEIGLRVTPRRLAPETYYGEIRKNGSFSHYSTGPFPITDYLGRRVVSAATSRNYTGYRSAEVDAGYAAAIATRDEAARAAALDAVQARLRADSGNLVWAASDATAAVAAGVTGMVAARPNTAAWARFDKAVLG